MTGGIFLPQDLKHWLPGQVVTQRFTQSTWCDSFSQAVDLRLQPTTLCLPSHCCSLYLRDSWAMWKNCTDPGWVPLPWPGFNASSTQIHTNDAQGFILNKPFFFVVFNLNSKLAYVWSTSMQTENWISMDRWMFYQLSRWWNCHTWKHVH